MTIKNQDIKILVSDCPNLQTLSPKVSEFLQNYWCPKAYKAGLKVKLYISSEDLISQISLAMLFEDVAKQDKLYTYKVQDYDASLKICQKLSRTFRVMGLLKNFSPLGSNKI